MIEQEQSVFLYLIAFLISAGVYVILNKRNLIFILIGIELIVNGANLLIAFFARSESTSNGQILAIFSVVLTVCEVAIALAILLSIYRRRQVSDLDQLKEIGND
ncbi:MAG: NADH-quinone oxidoreductase subunit NuoK [Bacteroidota bacterium]